METSSIIRTESLTKTYGGTTVVNNLGLDVKPGTVHGLLGPNGSGKSTTMKMLLGLVTPTSGQISMLGRPMNRATRPEVLAGVGSLIEAPSAYPHLTGGENMKIASRLFGASPENTQRAIELVRLGDHMDKLVKNYSLGMKQRLGIAMALARDPQILILDEPTNGLDPAGIEEIRALIVSLARDEGRTVLVSSHLLSEIEKMASNLTIIDRGRLIFQGSQQELYDAQLPDLFIQTPSAEAAASLLAALSPVQVAGGLEVQGLSDDQVADVCARLVSHGVPLHQVVRKRRSLEEIFIGLTGREGLERMIVEIAKLRRTKVVLLGFLLCAGIVLFAGMNLFAGGRIDDFRADPEASWAGHLVGYCMALAFLSPLQLAVVASRVVDTENVNGGWRLNAIAGVPPSTLIVRKFAVATVLVAMLNLVEFVGVIVVPLLMGTPVPGSEMLSTWAFFGLGALGTSLTLLAVMLWLAAVTDSQIVVLAIGVVGGFLGVAALLSPTWLAAINPFGYFAMLTPFTFGDSGISPTTPHWLAWGIYIITAVTVVTAATRMLDQKEL